MRTVTLILLVFCMPADTGWAQPSVPALTAERAVELAIRQNPRLSAAVRELEAARAGRRAARARANPTLTFTPAITQHGSDEELLAQQPLELNGTRAARARVAGAREREAQAEAVAALRELVFETRSAYYELARAQELRSLALDLQRHAEEIDAHTRRQVEAGARPGIDLTQTGIEVARARQQVTLTEGRSAAVLVALNTLMGRPPAEPVGPLQLPAPLTEAKDEGETAREALAARAEIAAAEAAREALEAEARLVRAEGRPDLVPQFRATSVTRGVEETGIGVGITLPLFDYGSRRERVRQLRAAARAQEDRIAAARARVSQEVEQALARLQASRTVVEAYQEGVLDQARRLLEASQTGFRAGATNIVALLEAQRTYRSVLTDHANALADYHLARAELERATGAVPAVLLPQPAKERPAESGRDMQ